jgi:hypothetical protein
MDVEWYCGPGAERGNEIWKEEQSWYEMGVCHIKVKQVRVWFYAFDLRAKGSEVGGPERDIGEKMLWP